MQVAYPELQKRKMERARHRQWRHDAVRAMQRHVKPLGSMLTEKGAPPAMSRQYAPCIGNPMRQCCPKACHSKF